MKTMKIFNILKNDLTDLLVFFFFYIKNKHLIHFVGVFIYVDITLYGNN